MSNIKTISPIEAISGKLSKLDEIYFRTNTLTGDVSAVKVRHPALRKNAQASSDQLSHQAAFKGLWKQVDTLLQQPVRMIYEDLYRQHILSCHQRRPISWDCKAVEAFLQTSEVIPDGIDKSAKDIIDRLRADKKLFSNLRTFVFHCLR